MSQEFNKEYFQKIVDDHAAQMLEHFGSVTILVTSHDGSSAETSSYDGGGGDLYARIGKAQEWITIQEQHARNWVSRKK